MFYCSQHECFDCREKTTNAGGMLFRCRWCELAYCEDCLDWDRTDLTGETLPEYLSLGFGAVVQAYYIVCPGCQDQQKDDPKSRAFCKRKTVEYDRQLQDAIGRADGEGAVRAESMTEATTVEGSGAITPAVDLEPSDVTTKLDPDGT